MSRSIGSLIVSSAICSPALRVRSQPLVNHGIRPFTRCTASHLYIAHHDSEGHRAADDPHPFAVHLDTVRQPTVAYQPTGFIPRPTEDVVHKVVVVTSDLSQRLAGVQEVAD